ncbi:MULTISPECIES: AzlD domain-containing protein [unclassified Comamonas]|uniref:AzlD domain-containing protein n=1 Tax=unclassified Comamonas TaxID=2638500 RepID=UPI001CE1380D|nr:MULTISPECIES: AzlD domain-containing protein [unclassified Comamonas]
MSLDLWHWIVLASAAAFALKLAGYAVPARWLQSPRMVQVAASMTVALLAALTVMNTFAAGTVLVADARLAALVVAGVALWLRAPFLLVVLLGAASAGITRWLMQG